MVDTARSGIRFNSHCTCILKREYRNLYVMWPWCGVVLTRVCVFRRGNDIADELPKAQLYQT